MQAMQRSILFFSLFLTIAGVCVHAQLPPFDLPAAEQLFFPHVVNGQLADGSFRTTFIFTNPSYVTAMLTVRLRADDGRALAVLFEGGSERRSTISFELKQGESYTLRTDGSGPFVSGYAEVEATQPVNSSLLLSQVGAEREPLTEANMEATALATEVTLPVQVGAKSNTGLAIASPASAANLSLRLYDAYGRLTTSTRWSIPAGQRRVLFVGGQLFPELRNFTGTLSVSSTVPVAAVSVRQNAAAITAVPAITGAFAGNGAEVLANLPVGTGPVTALAINPRTNKAIGIIKPFDAFGSVFIPGGLASGDIKVGDGVFTVDLNTNRHSAVDLGLVTPLDVAVNPATNTALVAVEASTRTTTAIKVLVLDLETNQVRSEIGPLVSTGGTGALDLLLPTVKLAVNPETNVAVAAYSSLSVPVLGGFPFAPRRGLALEPDLLVGKIFVIDLARGAVRKTITTPFGLDVHLAIDPRKNIALLSTGGPELSVLDLATDSITRTVPLGRDRFFFGSITTGPIAIHPEKEMVVVAAFEIALAFPPSFGSSLYVIDLSNFSVVATVPLATRTIRSGSFGSWTVRVVGLKSLGTELALAVNPATNSIVLTRATGNDILLLDWDSKTPLAAIPTGKGPASLAAATTDRILVGNADGSVSVTRLPSSRP